MLTLECVLITQKKCQCEFNAVVKHFKPRAASSHDTNRKHGSSNSTDPQFNPHSCLSMTPLDFCIHEEIKDKRGTKWTHLYHTKKAPVMLFFFFFKYHRDIFQKVCRFNQSNVGMNMCTLNPNRCINTMKELM